MKKEKNKIQPENANTFSEQIYNNLQQNTLFTDYVNAINLLKESENFLKETQIIARLGTYTLNIETGIWTSSEILDDIFGIDVNYDKSVEGWTSIIHPEWQKIMSDYFINEVIGTKTDFNKIYKILRPKDHQERWVHGIGKLKFKESNQPVLMVGTIRDITKSKLAEEKLNESEKKYRNIFENAQEGIFQTNIDGTYRSVNPTLAKMYGFNSPEELINSRKDISNDAYFDPTERDNFLKMMREQGYVKGYEYEVKRKDGKKIWFYEDAKAVKDEHGEIQYFEGFVVDITRRKHTEEVLLESEYRLARAEKVAKIGNWKLMLDTKEIISSPGARIIYGVEKEKLTLEDVQKIPLPEYREMLDNALMDLIIRDIPYNFEFKIRRQNDGEIVDIHSIADYDKTNNIVFGVIHDITERKATEHLLQQKNEEFETQNEEYLQINEEYLQLNEELVEAMKELNKAKEKAEESDRLKTAFLQNMSHEIRTPMNAIMGFSELLAENYNNKEKLEKFSQIISQRSNDLLDIINDILNIAKIESGQLPIYFEEINLTELFSELNYFFTEYQNRIGKNQINFSLRTQCPSTEKVIVTDKVKLKQIFINLIGNAFKYTDAGNIEGGCKLDDKNNLVFYVSDTGIGIPKDKHKLIFERFAQLNYSSTKLNSGTGLGLSIVKGLVELLGGEITVESEPNRGSTFTFSIPYKTSSTFNSEIPLVQKPKEFDFHNKTVLIVEDERYNAEYLKEILSLTGLNILHTEFGRDAVKIALNQKVDIVLMDIRLPDIDGWEATKQIREQNQLLKIIAQTAYASHIERQKTLDAGCNDYISKPINKELLLDMISKLLKG